MNRCVANYYDASPENEWNRLFRSPYRRIEYEVVLHYLTKYLPPKGHILDLGGGPGRYAIAMAKMGYQVTLMDLSQGNIDFAKRKIKNIGLNESHIHCETGDALDLSRFSDGIFDALLCMGPLYHLPKLDDRLLCLQECERVMKMEAPIFVTLLPRETYMRDALRAGTFANIIREKPHIFQDIAERGYSHDAQTPDEYFVHPDELRDWFDQTDFKLQALVSLYGFASFHDERVNQLSHDAEAWNALLHWIIQSCEEPKALASAEHLLGIGQKVHPHTEI